MKEGTKNWLMRNKALLFWQACHEAKNAFALGHFLGIQLGEKVWHAPVGGTFRVDVDAMFDPGGNKFGAGVIVRDSGSKIIVAMVRHIQTPETVLHAEILVVLSGLELCIEEKIQPISVFTYSLLTVRLIAGKDEVTDAILEDLQQVQMAGKQGGVTEVAHACRSATRAAHLLVQQATYLPCSFVWKSDFPEWLSDIVKDFA